MTKLVFVNAFRTEDEAMLVPSSGSGPGIWFCDEEMSNLLLACWHALIQIGDASQYVELIRVRFEANPGESAPRSENFITDIAFEFVFANPITGKKETETLLRIPPSFLHERENR